MNSGELLSENHALRRRLSFLSQASLRNTGDLDPDTVPPEVMDGGCQWSRGPGCQLPYPGGLRDALRVSPRTRMRQGLAEFRDSGTSDEAGDVAPELAGYDAEERDGDPLARRVSALEDENSELRDLAEDQQRQLDELTRRVAALEVSRQPDHSAQFVAVEDDVNGHGQGDRAEQDWRPPRRRHGMPDAGVVTLEEQPDEACAFGLAAPLVAEWRRVRSAGQESGSRVDRAVARVRR